MPEAEVILAKYHGDGDVNHPMVRLEIQEFNESITVEKVSYESLRCLAGA